MRRFRYYVSLLGEVVLFARANKAYWMVPLFVILSLVALLVVTTTVTAPYVYTLF